MRDGRRRTRGAGDGYSGGEVQAPEHGRGGGASHGAQGFEVAREILVTKKMAGFLAVKAALQSGKQVGSARGKTEQKP